MNQLFRYQKSVTLLPDMGLFFKVAYNNRDTLSGYIKILSLRIHEQKHFELRQKKTGSTTCHPKPIGPSGDGSMVVCPDRRNSLFFPYSSDFRQSRPRLVARQPGCQHFQPRRQDRCMDIRPPVFYIRTFRMVAYSVDGTCDMGRLSPDFSTAPASGRT